MAFHPALLTQLGSCVYNMPNRKLPVDRRHAHRKLSNGISEEKTHTVCLTLDVHGIKTNVPNGKYTTSLN